MTEAWPLRWPDGWHRIKPENRRSPHAFQNNTAYRAHSRILQELRLLGAMHVVVSSNAPPLKKDGVMSDAGNAQIEDPGVALYFQLDGRSMVMAQDLYMTPAANLRSLGIAIEAMRALERHGGGQMMQRAFDGFAALPPPGGAQGFQKRPWRDVLAMPESQYGVLPPEHQLVIAESTYKALAKQHHPDAQGGSADRMAELNLAIEDARSALEGSK